MATYTFENTYHRQATHINADHRRLLDGRQRAYPNDNYLSGDGKSTVWNGWEHYSPTNRSWHKHHTTSALPRERVVDLIEFRNEDDWRKWQRHRDTPGSGVTCASSGFRNAMNDLTGKPELQLSGYAFNPYNLYRTGVPARTLYTPHNPWPKTETRKFPTWRGPRGYYGYYHEELDVHQHGGYRYPRDPKVLVNDEDIMKYEYMRNTPGAYTKLPAEFPVLS